MAHPRHPPIEVTPQVLYPLFLICDSCHKRLVNILCKIFLERKQTIFANSLGKLTFSIILISDFSRAPLGMGNGFIADAQITGTSKYTFAWHDADAWSWDNARLKITGNRWCSKQPLNYADYVQVDFKEVITLTGVATQGDDNHAGNYVKKYYLEVSNDGTTFTDVPSSDCGTREVRFIATILLL